MGENKSIFSKYREVLVVLLGEVIASLIMVGVYLLIGKFHYSVITGAALGTLVTVVNLVILSVTVNRAVDRFMEERGTAEMTDEEAAAFANERATRVSLAASGTYILRILLMLGVVVAAFLLGRAFGVFDVIATVIPIALYRPIITVDQLIRNRKNPSAMLIPMPSAVPADKADTECGDGAAVCSEKSDTECGEGAAECECTEKQD